MNFDLSLYCLTRAQIIWLGPGGCRHGPLTTYIQSPLSQNSDFHHLPNSHTITTVLPRCSIQPLCARVSGAIGEVCNFACARVLILVGGSVGGWVQGR